MRILFENLLDNTFMPDMKGLKSSEKNRDFHRLNNYIVSIFHYVKNQVFITTIYFLKKSLFFFFLIQLQCHHHHFWISIESIMHIRRISHTRRDVEFPISSIPIFPLWFIPPLISAELRPTRTKSKMSQQRHIKHRSVGVTCEKECWLLECCIGFPKSLQEKLETIRIVQQDTITANISSIECIKRAIEQCISLLFWVRV